MRALVPVPSSSSTTDSSIWASVFAVFALTTRFFSGAGAGVKRPSGPLVPRTSVGATRTPPLAMVEYTDAACMALMETPWPKGIVYCCEVDHLSGGARMPLVSPGKPRPVSLPRPNSRR